MYSRHFKDTKISTELSDKECKYWFDFSKDKFLHNIDTFYYSIMLKNDFTDKSKDIKVHKFRKYLKKQLDILSSYPGDKIDMELYNIDLCLTKLTFAGIYQIHLQYQENFDFFIALNVPKARDNSNSVTPPIIVQIRAYPLWLYGVTKAYELSFNLIKKFLDIFNLEIVFTSENRLDYAWHTNYLQDPKSYFSIENFHKMRVDRFKDALFHTAKKGSYDYDIDYLALGKRSDKVFIRIYLKSKEVVEKGYKSWFFKIWLFNNLINRYDFYVYDLCYKKRSWLYLDRARLKWYLDYGKNAAYKSLCSQYLKDETIHVDEVARLANLLTPRVNLVINVEYQVMRKHSKSYTLLKLKDNSAYGVSERIYDLFDNRKLIIDYLTHYVFRLVDVGSDTNKSRAKNTAFWERLRKTKLVDCHVPKAKLKLIRQYKKNTDARIIKERTIKGIINYGLHLKGRNTDTFFTDVADFLSILNDNDIHDMLAYKDKRAGKLPVSEFDSSDIGFSRQYSIFDLNSGELYE